MKFEIRKYLINHKDDPAQKFSNFLRDSFPNYSRKRVRKTLLELYEEKSIAGSTEVLIAAFKPEEDLDKPMADFSGNIGEWSITPLRVNGSILTKILEIS